VRSFGAAVGARHANGEQIEQQLRAMASRNCGFQSDVGSSLIRAHFGQNLFYKIRNCILTIIFAFLTFVYGKAAL
jgi:hypothetical protein